VSVNDPDARVLDAAVLDELRASVEGDSAFVVDLVEAYLADGARHVAEVAAAIEAVDAAAVVRPAHTLKSSSATVGAMRLAGIARELEMDGRAGTLEAASAGERAAGVRTAWDEASTALRAWVLDEGQRA
jgi:HPt (histidine-containing phosphotransfer) domain-containing protein